MVALYDCKAVNRHLGELLVMVLYKLQKNRKHSLPCTAVY